MLATAGACGNAYTEAITSFLALRSGWSEAQVMLLRDGESLGDDRTGTLVRVVREAATRAGRVSDLTWQRAAECWSSEQLAEAFAYLGLTMFTAYFCHYAQTPADLPTPAFAATAE